MSESQNVEEETFSFQELYEYNTRNLAGCDNDDSCCTFPKGYVYRQALYHCLTCKEATGKQAGICYPCSVHCHSGHVLEDLYTKRNFRCDCGNGNFPKEFRCKLWEEKDDVNVKNQYNHNFSGRYCICDCEYNETQDTDEMVQCFICEDWFHFRHFLERDGVKSDQNESLSNEKYDDVEFICEQCVSRHEYLQVYTRAFTGRLLTLPDEHSKDDEIDNCSIADRGECQLARVERLVSGLEILRTGWGALWRLEWRQLLCRCKRCAEVMEKDDTQFLLNKRDSIAYYYNNSESIEDEIQQEMSSLPFSQAIKFAEGVGSLKRQLSEFMNSRDPSKVVTAEDVHDFFDNLKRRRLERYD